MKANIKLNISASTAAEMIEKNTVTGFDWYTCIKQDHPKPKDVRFKSIIYSDDKSFRVTRQRREYNNIDHDIKFQIALRRGEGELRGRDGRKALRGSIIPTGENTCEIHARIGVSRNVSTLNRTFLITQQS